MRSTTAGRVLYCLGYTGCSRCSKGVARALDYRGPGAVLPGLYRLQSVLKRREGTAHPDRSAQFERINATADESLTTGRPVISVVTKKKELEGNFANAGREWQPKGQPPAVPVHHFPSDARGKAIPYGVYDMAGNEAWVSDTGGANGSARLPNAKTLYITADAGVSNGYRSRAGKHASSGLPIRLA